MYHDIDFACDLSVVAWRSYQSGNVGAAKALYRRALGVFQRSKKETLPEIISVLNRLGLILESNLEYNDAAHCYHLACELMESEQEENRMKRLKVRSLYHFGRIRRKQGLQEEAEQLIRKAVDVAGKNLGQRDLEYAYAVNQLALLLRHQQKFAEARPLYYRALKIMEARLGSEHPRLASIFRNLSDLEFAAGRHKRGEPFARRAALLSRRRGSVQ